MVASGSTRWPGLAGPRWTAIAVAGALALAGCGSSGRGDALGDGTISAVKAVATVGSDRQPLDAIPSPDGAVIYFTVSGPGGPAVLRVSSTGGASSTVTSGAPLVRPVGVAVSTDGRRVYVADSAAGRIFILPAGGGAPTVVEGTESRSPRGLHVAASSGSDVIYFTGTDPADGSPALFSVPGAGGSVKVLAKGAPLVSPDAIVVAPGGVAYVTDRGAGAIYKLGGSGVFTIAKGHLGNPAGVSVTKDGKTLLVSSQNPTSGSDQVILVDLATGRTGVVSKVIGANHNDSGGLHRADRGAFFAWADTMRGGRVYRVDP